jgi:nucleotide-binding universal stress UspA family protein
VLRNSVAQAADDRADHAWRAGADDSRPIVVGIDGSDGGEVALRWALDDALVRNAPVQLICCNPRPLNLNWEGVLPTSGEDIDHVARRSADYVVERALERAREIAPALEITGEVVDGRAADVLSDRSADAAAVVVGSRRLKALGSTLLGSVGAGLAAGARCPVVVVRGPAGLAAERPAVVVGIDGTDAAGPALEFGFAQASRYGLPLRAVMCWRPDPLAAMQWRAAPPPPQRVEAWLSEILADVQPRYPDVAASGAVIRSHPVPGLVAQSAAEHLLVVHSRSRHALTGTLLGSVTQGVLHHATCPVAVIPAAAQ